MPPPGQVISSHLPARQRDYRHSPLTEVLPMRMPLPANFAPSKSTKDWARRHHFPLQWFLREFRAFVADARADKRTFANPQHALRAWLMVAAQEDLAGQARVRIPDTTSLHH
jgi:hypothetical protein